jgi:ketosteroid isomerase-like protein
MRSTVIALALLLGVVSVAGAQQQPSPAEHNASPTPEASRVFAQEQKAWNAVQASDVAAFNKLVTPPFTYIDATGITGWNAATSQRLKDCTTTDFQTSDVHTQQPAAGVVILSYRATMNQVCKGVKSPSPIYAMSVWQQDGRSWKLVAHSESHGHAEH